MYEGQEDMVKEMISQIEEEIEKIKEENKNLIVELGLEKLLVKLNENYLKGEGLIATPDREIYVKTFDKEWSLIVNFIYLFKSPTFFFIAALNGKCVYVTALYATVNENKAADLLEADLNCRKLTERENLIHFEKHEMIGAYYKDIDETDLEKINKRIARIFFEAFLKDKVLQKTGGGPSDGD